MFAQNYINKGVTTTTRSDADGDDDALNHAEFTHTGNTSACGAQNV